jgi:hypothetical protein
MVKKGGNVFFSGMKAAVTGKRRQDFSPESRKVLATFGHREIKSLKVIRTPVRTPIRKLLNAISLGSFDKEWNKLDYDQMYHLSLVAEVVETGSSRGGPGRLGAAPMKQIQFEKNLVLRVDSTINTTAESEFMWVTIPSGLTISSMLQNARNLIGDDDFFLYRPFSTNCQHFITAILKANGLLTPDLKNFVLQSIENLVNKFSPVFRNVAQALTNVGATADLVLKGEGLSGSVRSDDDIHKAIDAVTATRGGKSPMRFVSISPAFVHKLNDFQRVD